MIRNVRDMDDCAVMGYPTRRSEFLSKDIKTYKMFRDYVDRIVDGFNIQKCVEYMERTSWTWASCGDQVPTEQEFRENLREQLLRVCEESDSRLYSSGGITIIVEDYWKDIPYSEEIEDIEEHLLIQVYFSIESYF